MYIFNIKLLQIASTEEWILCSKNCHGVVLKPLQFWAAVLPEEFCHGRAPCLYPTNDGFLRIRSLSLCTGFHRASALMGEITGNNLYFARISVRISKPNNPF